ncbi:MAG: ribosome silencing factor [Erysipelotrichaceae bacterium]
MSELLQVVVNAVDDKKANQIIVLDMHEVNPWVDYFVVCDAQSLRQVHAIADNAVEQAEKAGFYVDHVEGGEESDWLLVDCGNVVVHVFSAEARQVYQLERLWADKIVKR